MKYLSIILIFLFACSSNNDEGFVYGSDDIYENNNYGYTPSLDYFEEDVDAPDNGVVVDDEITSAIIGEDYLLKVYLPENYENESNYPVVYIMDGNWLLDNVQKYIIRFHIKAIIVAIDNNDTRNRDYMPVNTCLPDGGGYENYREFLITELVPYIESKYKTDEENRVLAGHSFSGAMSLITLFTQDTQTPTFNLFLASDSSVLCDPEFFNNLLQDKVFPNGFTVKLHMSKSYVNSSVLINFANLMKNKNYKWLDIDWRIYNDKNHETVTDPSFKDGIQHLFQDFK